MTTVYDVQPTELIKGLAEVLKKEEAIKAPEWAPYVKTGGDKEKQPEEKDWWYTRTASILRKIHVHGPVGIPTLRREYGGKKNRGHNPAGRRRGSGSVIRGALQQLEKAGLVKKTKVGRITTPKGVSLLDKTASQLKRSKG